MASSPLQEYEDNNTGDSLDDMEKGFIIELIPSTSKPQVPTTSTTPYSNEST